MAAGKKRITIRPATWERLAMPQTFDVNPASEHALFIKLFITNGGGW
jgi:hypothetical protein